MRGIGAALAVIVAMLAAAPARAQDNQSQNKPAQNKPAQDKPAQDQIGARLDALEQRVAHLEALVAKEQNQATEIVTLSRWSAAFAQGDLSKSYKIAYTLQSHCDKPIKLLDGYVDFLDPDGKRIYSIPLIREAAIDADGKARFTGTYFLNPAQPDQVRLRDLPPERVSTQLHVRRIVFRDNSVLPLE